mgnify:CR=1 FL=1
MKRKYSGFRLALFCILSALILGMPKIVLSQEPETSVYLNPADSTATTCAVHTITVDVSDVDNLTGYHLELSFDPAVVQVTEVMNGGFLTAPEDPGFYEPTNEIDNVTGFISFGMVQQNDLEDPMTPKSGTGSLIQITMQAQLPNGSTNFTIDAENSTLVDWPDAFEVDFVTTDGVVNTASCPPTDISLSNSSVLENEPVGTTVGELSATDPDVGDTFTYSLVQDDLYPDNLAFTIDGNTLKTGEVLNFEAKGTYTIRIRGTDGGGETYAEEFVITVGDVNEAPTAEDDTYSTLKNQVLQVAAPGVLSNDEDPDAGDSLLALKVSNPDHGTVVLGANGDLSYVPPTDWTGTTSFTYQVYDGEFYSSSATVTIHVNESNQAPTAITISEDSVSENQQMGTEVGIFSTTDPDVPLDSFIYTLVTGTGDADNALFEIQGDSLVTSAVFDFETKDSYSIRVRSTDQGGLWVEEIFTISILDVNDPPEASDQSKVTDENTALGITLEGSDEDEDTLTFVLVSSPTNGLLTWTPPNVTYTPDIGFVGTDSFEYKVIDDPGESSNTGTVTITVNEVSNPPTAINLSNNVMDENAGINALVGILSTVDPDLYDTFTYTLVTGAGDDDNASFTLQGDQLLALESFDYETKDTYTIRVRSTDQDGLWVEQSFVITVMDVNEAPVAISKSVSTEVETQLNVLLEATDEDDDLLSYYIVSLPQRGTLTGTAPNMVYTPDIGFTGQDSFTFIANDGEKISDIATITIQVEEAPAFYYYLPLITN